MSKLRVESSKVLFHYLQRFFPLSLLNSETRLKSVEKAVGNSAQKRKGLIELAQSCGTNRH